MSEPLHTKYRPRNFDEVVGQAAAVKSLRRALGDGAARTFLFVGPPGTGKTTLARLAAAQLGCLPQDLEEVDAATRTGVDDMREVTSRLMYRPLGEGKVRAIILDEAHMLSKSAWNSLLKILEEPPEWVVWFLCTTEPTKVPQSVRTRCLTYEMKPVSSSTLTELLEEVARAEGLFDGPSGPKILQLCAKEAGGSPRQALVNMAACVGADHLKDAQELLRSAEDSAEVVELARALVRGANWAAVQELLGQLKEVDPESVRRVVRAYVANVALGTSKERDAEGMMAVLDAFSEPCYDRPALVLACGKLVMGED